jgi:hypothetical protein
MKGQTRPVKPAALGVIGREHIETRFREMGCDSETFDHRKELDFTEDEHLPYVVEVAFACFKDQTTQRRLITGLNCSPAIRNPFRQLGQFFMSLDTLLARQEIDCHDPVAFLLHASCPVFRYTDRGKSTVALGGQESEDIEQE